jgi:hypothetical protein
VSRGARTPLIMSFQPMFDRYLLATLPPGAASSAIFEYSESVLPSLLGEDPEASVRRYPSDF